MDCTVEPEDVGFLVKLQTDEWEANVHASAEELLRLSDDQVAQRVQALRRL